MEIKQQIRSFLEPRIPKGAVLEDGDNIFEKGFVNSLFALQLVTFLESEFDLMVENEDLNLDNFSSVAGMEQFVIRKKEGAKA